MCGRGRGCCRRGRSFCAFVHTHRAKGQRWVVCGEEKSMGKHFYIFFFLLYGVEVAVEHFEVRKRQGFWEGREFGGC